MAVSAKGGVMNGRGYISICSEYGGRRGDVGGDDGGNDNGDDGSSVGGSNVGGYN